MNLNTHSSPFSTFAQGVIYCCDGSVLTLVLPNKLRCQALFKFSGNQIT